MKCPTCGKPAEPKDNPFRPFCSERCKMIDLGRWINDEYRVAGTPIPSESADAPQPSQASQDFTEDH